MTEKQFLINMIKPMNVSTVELFLFSFLCWKQSRLDFLSCSNWISVLKNSSFFWFCWLSKFWQTSTLFFLLRDIVNKNYTYSASFMHSKNVPVYLQISLTLKFPLKKNFYNLRWLKKTIILLIRQLLTFLNSDLRNCRWPSLNPASVAFTSKKSQKKHSKNWPLGTSNY